MNLKQTFIFFYIVAILTYGLTHFCPNYKHLNKLSSTIDELSPDTKYVWKITNRCKLAIVSPPI